MKYLHKVIYCDIIYNCKLLEMTHVSKLLKGETDVQYFYFMRDYSKRTLY